MCFLVVEPEIAGTPRRVAADLEVSFGTWLGDDLVRAFPMFLVTRALRDALAKVPAPTGFDFTSPRIRSSSFFRKHNPGRRLPRFWALEVEGQEFRIGRATVMQYTPTDPVGSPREGRRGTRGS